MISVRKKNLFLIMFWCIGCILIFSNQAVGYQCSPEPTDDLIRYGDTVTCKINPEEDTDTFRFSGVDGDKVALQTTRKSGGIPCMELFDPDGDLITAACFNPVRMVVTLRQTGRHKIIVTEFLDNSTVDYTLALERITPPSAPATPINPGEVRSDAIDPVGDLDLLFFRGDNGDTVEVEATRQSGGTPCIELFDPDGYLVDLECSSTARIDVNLDQTGTHTILVTEFLNNQTMDYEVSYECNGGCPEVFKDVSPGHWAWDHIYAIFDAEIAKGCSQNPLKYCPNDDVTRKQIAAFIVRAKEEEPPANYCDTGSAFSDVSPASGFCKYIKRLSELGVTNGCGGGNYCPNDPVTREQIAAFIVRAKVGETPDNYCDTGSLFSDVAPASGFCKYIKRLSEMGITNGCGGGKYCPNNTVKRDQMAVFLERAF